MIRTVIFDWGGVLAEPDNKTAAEILKKDFNFDKNNFIDYFDKNEDKYLISDNYEKFLDDLSNKIYILVEKIIEALNSSKTNEVFIIAKKIAKLYDTYILSNQLKYRTDYIKDNFDLRYFKKAFFSNEIGLKKPDKEIFEFFLNQSNSLPEECLFVDDNINNIRSAREMGIKAIHFNDMNAEELKKKLTDFGINY